MSEHIYLARQPILDRDREIFGYELFHRDRSGSRGEGTPRHATSSVLVGLLNQIGAQRCVGDKKAFVNIGGDILQTDILTSLLKELFVFELSERMRVGVRERDAVVSLHRLGYTFALDNVSLSREYYRNFSPLFPCVTYAKFDATATDTDSLRRHIGRFARFRLIAQKVERDDVARYFDDLGFDYFQGNFFAPPALLQQGIISPKHLGVIRLYNMLQNEEPLPRIAEEFQRHNELSMQLLQFAGSSGLSSANPASSLREIIERLGVKALQLWLLLIVFSKSGHYVAQEKSLLSRRIERRIDIMLALMPRLGIAKAPKRVEQIRFLAFLSRVEETFRMPLAALLEQLELHESITEALLAKQGELGRLLALAEAVETSHLETVRTYLKQYGLPLDAVADIIEKYQEF